MDVLFILFILFAVGAAVVAFVVKVLLVGFAVKAGVDAYTRHQQLFNQQADQLQRLLQGVQSAGGAPSSHAQQQFMSAWYQARNELNQLDDLRRQQSELRLADLHSQAASVGIFLD